VITVRDEGSGIPPEQRERIFDPFFTTKDNGTGLGLAIASTIVEQHGGTLSAVNAPGRGLDVVVQLPLYRTVAR
jgi:signal transduction histidine kinase